MQCEKKEIQSSEHGLTGSETPEKIKEIVKTLQEKGHETYIVGGAVRDMLLGKTPKDFDLVTSAEPNEVKECFSRCTLVGRRFRLAHVFINKNTKIEISTFRAAPVEGEEADSEAHAVNEEGRIIRSNNYGTNIEEDVMQRDFTINALYLNPMDNIIIDYINGYDDVKNKRIAFVNTDVEASIKQDPVRILRIIRSAIILSTKLSEEHIRLIQEHRSLLSSIPSARIMAETVKLFHSGKGVSAYAILEELQLSEVLFGAVLPAVEGDEEPPIRKFINLALQNTDERINNGTHTSKAFLMAVLYWPYAMNSFDNVLPEATKVIDFTKLLFTQQLRGLPRFFQNTLSDIWRAQEKFRDVDDKNIPGLCRQRYFRGAYDFYLLRVTSGLEAEQHLELWTQARDQYAPVVQNMNTKQGGRERNWRGGNNRNRHNKSNRGSRRKGPNESNSPNELNSPNILTDAQKAEQNYESYSDDDFNRLEPEAAVTSKKFNMLDNV